MTTSIDSKTRNTRPVSWLRAARRAFETFPIAAQSICYDALSLAAEGVKSEITKPLHGLGSGVLEIALPYRGDAYRVVYALQLAEDIWVVHAFQKKSKTGIKTPKHEIDLIKQRIRLIREMFS
jgi:phage-related protein